MLPSPPGPLSGTRCAAATQVGYLRPQCTHPAYSNLYFAGSSCHPGSGLPNVLVSARLAANRAIADAGLPPPSTAPSSALLNPRYAPIPGETGPAMVARYGRLVS